MNKLLSGTFFWGILLAFCAGTSVAADEDKSKSTDAASDTTAVTKQVKPSKPAARKAFRQRQHARHVTHPNRAAILNNRRINRAGE